MGKRLQKNSLLLRMRVFAHRAANYAPMLAQKPQMTAVQWRVGRLNSVTESLC